MFTVILSILINIFLLCRVETISINNEAKCTVTMLGCHCQNIENITKESVEVCSKSNLKSLLITGFYLKNVSINIKNSPCSESFQTLSIRETDIAKFHSPFYGLNNIQHVLIENNPNLTDLNKLIFSEISNKIEDIVVEFNNIRSISNKTFANLFNLVSLKLSDNKIGFIEDRSFATAPNLTYLYLNNNILTKPTEVMFYGLEKLRILSLLNNYFTEISSNIFKYLQNLQFLHLSIVGTDFTKSYTIPDNVFFPVKKLKYLNMTMKIKNLTSLTFYGLTELERLDLQGNLLTSLTSGCLQQLPKVTTINLSKNQISCLLPDTFSRLPLLKSLDLSNNDLSYISNEVFADLNMLQTLDLAENNIYVIEKNAFIGLKHLLIFKINIIHGKAKNEIQNNFQLSPLAKLSNSTKIIGLMEFLGIFKGLGEPPELLTISKPKINGIESKKNNCPSAGASDKDWTDLSNNGNRKYLLIIVGICVVFLLIAFAIIMSYRAWSKHKMSDLSFNVEPHEKQEMLINKGNVVNGRVDKPHSKSNQTRKSLNGSYVPDLTVEKNEEKSDVFLTKQTQQPNLQASIKPVTCPLSNERNHSDDESALTPLGVL